MLLNCRPYLRRAWAFRRDRALLLQGMRIKGAQAKWGRGSSMEAAVHIHTRLVCAKR